MSLRHGVPKNLPFVVRLHVCHGAQVTNHQPPQFCGDSLATRHSPLPTFPVTPLECAVPSKHRVLPGFGRSCPPVTPLECAVTQIGAVSPLECALTKKRGGPLGSSQAQPGICFFPSSPLSSQPSLDKRSRTRSLKTLPSTVLPCSAVFAAFTTAPICFIEFAPVSEIALAIAASISASLAPAGR